ncbi:MAG: FAD:protein FMN transferase [Acidimicrobiia bacterium]|nr:FAD:protein FMN transferase [Acidimicrobiia bacterium]
MRVVADDASVASALADVLVARVEHLERRWSRFNPDSEVSRVNAAGGRPVAVSDDTALLVATMVEASQLTAGRYDPTLLDALRDVGYGDTWDPDRRFVEDASVESTHRGHGCGGIHVDLDTGVVEMAPGVAIEPGGIGKGLAGDLLVADAVAGGASGVMIDLGGDVRVHGDAGDGPGWLVAIEDPHERGRDLAAVEIETGAVCTSSRLLRRWFTHTGPAHHLLDPATGRPVDGELDAVTVVAGTGWWAEALTKAVFVAGLPDAVDLIRESGCSAALVTASGEVVRTGDLLMEEVA